MNTLKTGNITANGVNFGFIEAGEGDLMMMLHGFPDHAASFEGQNLTILP